MAKNNDYLTSGGERASYGFYFSGQLVFYMLVTSFLVPYFTDIGIPALTVAAIALVVKIWDAVNDPIFGGIIDKVRFKKGKFLPWLKISVVAIPLSTIFLFAAPMGISLQAKIIWVIIGYILWDTAYTICDVPIFGLVTTLTNRVPERNYLLALTRIFSGVGALAVIVALPLIRSAIGGWFPTAILLSVVGGLVMLPVLFKANERYTSGGPEDGYGIKDILRYLSVNKYLLIYFLAVIIYGSGSVGLTMYFARYNLGNESLLSILSLVGFVPTLLVSFVMPALIKKVEKFTLFFSSLIGTLVLGIIMYFVGYHNLTAYMVMLVLRGITGAGVLILGNMFTPDMVEYGRYKSGINASGISFAVQTFSAKLQAALATALGALCLSLIGFVEGEGAVQPDGFADKLWLIMCLIPIVMSVIAIPLFSRYKLRDKYVAVMAKFNNGEISREEAEKVLEGKI
jgi:sugar (glycoside-pentoside-hexuronide) transporter